MKKEQYQNIARQILELIGTKDNVTFATHCMTRLRFNLKDNSLVNEDGLKQVKGVIGTQYSSGQLQIIIGQTVEHVYKELCEIGGFEMQASIDEVIDKPKEKLTLKGIGAKILDSLAGSVVPLIPLMMASSMFKMLVAILGPGMLNVLSVESDLFKLFTFVGDAGFYFFPIVLGYTAAKKFGVTTVIGMFMGAVMMHPTFVGMAVEGSKFTVFGIPCVPQNYASTLIPMVLTVWIMSYVEKFFKKIMPQSLKTIFVPFCTVLVMLPISLCALGPVGSFVGNYACDFLLGLGQVPYIGFLSVAIIAALWEFLVMSGMHLVFITSLIIVFSQNGSESIVSVAACIASIATCGMLLGSFLKIKDKEEKNLTLGYFIAAIIGGVTEPGLYGNGMKYKKPFIGLLAGGFAGGLYAGIMSVSTYAMVPVANIMGLTSFVGGSASNLINGLIACGIAFVVATAVTYLTGYSKEN